MATVRAGDRRALVVVDVQVGVVANAWARDRVVANVARAVELARAATLPVIWVQHDDDELPAGSIAWRWVPELSPHAGELCVAKHFNSAFEQTGLEDALAVRGVSHIVLAGAASNWCIRATAHAALDRGYDLTLVSDAHTTEDLDLDDGTRIRAEDVVRELNVALTWLSYPGRRTAARPVADLGLGGP
jgi:nicotinamidase-related amidase